MDLDDGDEFYEGLRLRGLDGGGGSMDLFMGDELSMGDEQGLGGGGSSSASAASMGGGRGGGAAAASAASNSLKMAMKKK